MHPLHYSLFVAAIMFFLVGVASSMNLEADKNTTTSGNVVNVKVGLLLDSSWKSKVLLKYVIEMAQSDFYATHSLYTTRLSLHTLYPNNSIDVASAAVELLEDQVKAILGPKSLVEANFVTDLAEKSQVPIISFDNAGCLYFHIQRPYLIRNSVADSILPVIALIKGYKWDKIAFVYEDGMFDTNMFPFLFDSFQRDGIHMSYVSNISSIATDKQISNELRHLDQLETTVFVVHMRHLLGSRFFRNAKRLGMMTEGYAWVITDSLANSMYMIDPKLKNSLDGILGIRPHVPSSRELERRLQEHSHMINATSITPYEVSVHGLWAYDTIWALATSIEDIKNEDLTFSKAKNNKNGGEISQLGISRVGDRLFKEITNKISHRLGAKFIFSSEEIDQFNHYQIFNVDGGERIVGYWSSAKGISRGLDSNDTSKYSTSVDSLKKIIWPGETTDKPIGWILPKNGKKLKVSVPKKMGFTQFVKVERNNDTNEINVTGFCIDLFEEALKLLPFKLHKEDIDYIPFMNSSGQSNGTYDELLLQLTSKTVDAVVGDTTIMANRTKYVDFTFPYSDPGIVMLVPIKDRNPKGIWVFIRPLKWDLWFTLLGACLFVGLAIYILERNGDRPREFVLFFCFPILILAFPERKFVRNNWSRFVLVMWLFMAYIIMQGYTASLSSILTIEQLQPSRTNFSCVGYYGGSYAKDILTRKLKYEESQLRTYQTMDQYASALKNGCQNGGADAIFDEIPSIRLFMQNYGPKYMTVGRTHHTDGLAFAFPLGSPLVPYISKAIINITENEVMMENLEKKHFGEKYSSQDISPQISPDCSGLNAYNFGGLFIITASATIIALLFSETSLGKKIASKVKNSTKKQESSSSSSSKVVAVEDGDHSIVSINGVCNDIGLPTHIHQDDAHAHVISYVEADEDAIYEEVELTVMHNKCLSI